MNLVNHGKKYTTFNFIVCEKALLKKAQAIAMFLINSGHFVIVSSVCFESEEISPMLQRSIEVADMTVVFSSVDNPIAEEAKKLVRQHKYTYIINVVPPIKGLSRKAHELSLFHQKGRHQREDRFDDTLCIKSLIKFNGIRKRKILKTIANLAAYQ